MAEDPEKIAEEVRKQLESFPEESLPEELRELLKGGGALNTTPQTSIFSLQFLLCLLAVLSILDKNTYFQIIRDSHSLICTMPNENYDKLAKEFREKLEIFKQNVDSDELKEKFLKAAGSIIKSKRDQFYWMIFSYFLIFVVLLLLVFFGYKLYKSLAERERKKEEKKRQKQQKKKK